MQILVSSYSISVSELRFPLPTFSLPTSICPYEKILLFLHWTAASVIVNKLVLQLVFRSTSRIPPKVVFIYPVSKQATFFPHTWWRLRLRVSHLGSSITVYSWPNRSCDKVFLLARTYDDVDEFEGTDSSVLYDETAPVTEGLCFVALPRGIVCSRRRRHAGFFFVIFGSQGVCLLI